MVPPVPKNQILKNIRSVICLHCTAICPSTATDKLWWQPLFWRKTDVDC